jgi:lauroyl/myristoyl acyltransferase
MKVAYARQGSGNMTLRRIICRCEEFIYRLVLVPLVAFLPAPVAYGLACWRGDWRCRLDRTRRNQIIASLEGVFGEQLGQAERLRQARDFFRRQSCQAIDALRLAGKGRALSRLVEIRGLEHLEAALASGKGAVVCIAHFGSIVSCCSLLGANGLPVTAVGNATPNHNGMVRVEQLMRRFHLAGQTPRHLQRPNIEPDMGGVEAAMHMAEVLRANEAIVIAIDVPVAPQDRPHAVPVEFLGRQILLLPGSVSIAEHTGAVVLVAVAKRSPNWRQQVLELSPPISINGDVETAFKQCVTMVEAPIRQHPAFWDGWLNVGELADLGLLPVEAVR